MPLSSYVEDTETTGLNPTYNKALLIQYKEYLLDKYNEIRNNEYSTQALVKITKELNYVQALILEQDMDTHWDSLNKAFGVTGPRPDSRDTKKDEEISFREKMSGKSLDMTSEEF